MSEKCADAPIGLALAMQPELTEAIRSAPLAPASPAVAAPLVAAGGLGAGIGSALSAVPLVPALGGAFGAASAPSGRRVEGFGRGALRGTGIAMGTSLGGGLGAGVGASLPILAGATDPRWVFGATLAGGALGAGGGAVLGDYMARKLIGRPTWEHSGVRGQVLPPLTVNPEEYARDMRRYDQHVKTLGQDRADEILEQEIMADRPTVARPNSRGVPKTAAGPLDNPVTGPLVGFLGKHFPETTGAVTGAVNNAANQAIDSSVAGRISDFTKANPWVQGAGIGALGGAALGGLYGLTSRRKNKWRAAGDALAGAALGGLGGGLLHGGLNMAAGAALPKTEVTETPPPVPQKAPPSLARGLITPMEQLAGGPDAPAPTGPLASATTPLAGGVGLAAGRYGLARPALDHALGGKLDPSVTKQTIADARLSSGNAADAVTQMKRQHAANEVSRQDILSRLKDPSVTTVPAAQDKVVEATRNLNEAEAARRLAGRTDPELIGELDRAVASAKTELAAWKSEVNKLQTLAKLNDPNAAHQLANAERNAAAAAEKLKNLQATRPTPLRSFGRRLVGGPATWRGALGEAGLFSGLLAGAGRAAGQGDLRMPSRVDLLAPPIAGVSSLDR